MSYPLENSTGGSGGGVYAQVARHQSISSLGSCGLVQELDLLKTGNCIGIAKAKFPSPNKNHKEFHITWLYRGVSENSGTPKSSILIGFSTINHPFWGTTIVGNTRIGAPKYPSFVLGFWAQKILENGRVLLKSRVTVTRYASTSILVIPCRTSRIFILSLTYSNLASNPCRETCGKTFVVGTCGKWLHFFGMKIDEMGKERSSCRWTH